MFEIIANQIGPGFNDYQGACLKELIGSAQSQLLFCVPFISHSGVDYILESLQSSKAKKLFIITEFTDQAITAGTLSLKAIAKLMAKFRSSTRGSPKNVHKGITCQTLYCRLY